MKYFVLDLDGTLIDSSERHYLLMQELLWKLVPEQMEDHHFDPAEFMTYKADGHSGRTFLQEILRLPEESAGEIMTLWQQQIEEERWLGCDRLYPDTIPFLEKIKALRGQICYLTARQNKEGLLDELQRLEIGRYAEEVHVVPPMGALEYKKHYVEELLRKAGKEEVYIVGDTENEYELAREFLLPYSILDRGFRSKKYWEKRGVDTVSALSDMLGQLR